MEIWISNEQEKVDLAPDHEALIQRVAERALELAGAHLGPNVSVSITLVDDEAITDLNRDHRGLASPTDVLSFSQLEGEEMGDLPEGEPLPLGDIVISLERCLAQAADYGHSFERELGFLTAHGMLHLLGWDHQTPDEEAAMMAKTEEILGGLGLSR
ncbi:putative rRNA maturation factor [Symbiobacterium terraclitae]|jgi:probable rRNA maturation factor|uniref:Endoribonuclease YbeY n=1 Tax=Symbiobacterium terraclitae TaxID=557451 RepID=A0ABS4JP62_9FIRM|nr:rRNA maturation RNase YbeY [Symbiobacterium terraclitae]MBP2017328.1 putative rRNA maturation factor [Symbiobacterium terraclitae]